MAVPRERGRGWRRGGSDAGFRNRYGGRELQPTLGPGVSGALLARLLLLLLLLARGRAGAVGAPLWRGLAIDRSLRLLDNARLHAVGSRGGATTAVEAAVSGEMRTWVVTHLREESGHGEGMSVREGMETDLS